MAWHLFGKEGMESSILSTSSIGECSVDYMDAWGSDPKTPAKVSANCLRNTCRRDSCGCLKVRSRPSKPAPASSILVARSGVLV